MEQRKPNWLVISGASAAMIVGVTGMALASSGGDDDGGLPGGISLEDRVPVTATIATPRPYDVITQPIVTGDPNDSPFDARDGDFTADSPDVLATNDSPDGAPDASVSWDSPDAAAPGSVAPQAPPPVTDDSWDSPAVAPQAAPPAPMLESADSLDSASFDSPDNS